MIKVKLINSVLISENEFKDSFLVGTREDLNLYLKCNDLFLVGRKLICKEFNKTVGYFSEK